MNPQEYAEFHGVESKKEEKAPGLVQLLVKAPTTFWTVGLVQFFCWAAFLYMWTYTTGATNQLAFRGENGSAPTAKMISSYKDSIGDDITCAYVQYDSLLIVEKKVIKHDSALVWLQTPGKELQVASVAETVVDENTGSDYQVLSSPKPYIVPEKTILTTKVDIDVTSKEYGEAGNWCGVLFAIQAIGSIIWALVIPYFRRRKLCYSLSLLIGAVGFISTFFITNKWLLGVSFLLVGCAWAAMLAIPFTIFTNSLKNHIGSYLGLFNCTICLPQIVAALIGPKILGLFDLQGGVVYQPYMLLVAGVLLVLGAASVVLIKEGKK
jgi:hypothetical protein